RIRRAWSPRRRERSSTARSRSDVATLARLGPTPRDPAALHREDATPEQDGAGPPRYGRGFGSHRSRLLTRPTRSPGRRSGAGLRPRSRAARPALEPWPRTPLAAPPHGGVAVLPSRA